MSDSRHMEIALECLFHTQYPIYLFLHYEAAATQSNTMVTSRVQCNNTGNFTHSWFNVSEAEYLGKSVYYFCLRHFLPQYTPKCARKCRHVFVPNIHYYCPLFNHTGICYKVSPQGNLSNDCYIVTHAGRQEYAKLFRSLSF